MQKLKEGFQMKRFDEQRVFACSLKRPNSKNEIQLNLRMSNFTFMNNIDENGQPHNSHHLYVHNFHRPNINASSRVLPLWSHQFKNNTAAKLDIIAVVTISSTTWTGTTVSKGNSTQKLAAQYHNNVI